jgi:probable HAF family extracellular repeat protein
MKSYKHGKASVSLGALALLVLTPASHQLAAQEQQSDGAFHYVTYNLGAFGGSSSSGNAINNLGWVFGNANLAGNQTTRAAVWIDGMKFDLGTLGGPNSVIDWPVHNDRGVISGFAQTAELDPLQESWSCAAFFPPTTNNVCAGFRWFEGTMTRLPTLGGTNGYGAGVNQRGEIVGWAENKVHDSTCVLPQVLQFEAVIWGPDGKIRELPPLPEDQDGAATAINDRGDVVGISGTCDNAVGAYTAKHAVIWHDGVPLYIKTFGGKGWNTPADINNHGQVVGFADLPGDVVDGVLTPQPVGFIWSEAAGIQKIPPLPGDTNTIAYAINNRGQVVGQSFGGPEGSRAFIWQNGKTYDLNSFLSSGSPLYLIYAEGINDRGEITGGACVAVEGSCATATLTPAFLAVPSWAPNDASEAAPLAEAAAAGPPPQVTVARDVYLRPLRRWGFRP